MIVFDCDGVLLDTMPAKIKAFKDWVPKAYAEYEAAFMDKVMHGFGQSRRKHIEDFYREIIGISPQVGWIEDEIDRFSRICEPMCAKAGWRRGSREFVRSCVNAGVKRYVLSGTPQQELEEMIRANGGHDLFDRIYGSPPAKPERIEAILAETGCAPDRAVFIGDANEDRLAAEHVGAHFVYFPSEAAKPEGMLPTEVDDLRKIEDFDA